MSPLSKNEDTQLGDLVYSVSGNNFGDQIIHYRRFEIVKTDELGREWKALSPTTLSRTRKEAGYLRSSLKRQLGVWQNKRHLNMKTIIFLLLIEACSTKQEYHENEFADEDLECLEAEFDDDRSTSCTLK